MFFLSIEKFFGVLVVFLLVAFSIVDSITVFVLPFRDFRWLHGHWYSCAVLSASLHCPHSFTTLSLCGICCLELAL